MTIVPDVGVAKRVRIHSRNIDRASGKSIQIAIVDDELDALIFSVELTSKEFEKLLFVPSDSIVDAEVFFPGIDANPVEKEIKHVLVPGLNRDTWDSRFSLIKQVEEPGWTINYDNLDDNSNCDMFFACLERDA